MKKSYNLKNFIVVLVIIYSVNIYSQNNFDHKIDTLKKSDDSQLNFMALSIGLISVLYLFNPVLAYKDKKIYGGFTKEFSVGFGSFGEHRIGTEYTYIFAGENRHSLRFSYKYDILLKKGLQPSNSIQYTPVLSIGGGYFTDFKKNGFFPEISYGISLRSPKVLIYPHIKIRFTYILDKKNHPDYNDNADISAGIMIGIANPFIDLKIRRRY